MARATKFYKQICAVATAVVMVAGSPLCVHATGSGAADPDNEIIEETSDQDSDDNDESDNDEEDSTDDTEETVNSGNSGSGSGSTGSNDADSDDDEDDDIDADDESGAEDDDEFEGEEADPLDEDHPSGILMIDPDPVDVTSAEGGAGGNGIVRITTIKKPKNVVSMVVPILDNINYNFVMDPEGLLSLNPENTIIGGESTLYFRSNESDSTYSIFAEVATAINKSTVPVSLEVELEVRGTAENGINITDLNGVHSAETPSMCLAILPTEVGTVREGESADDLSILKSGMAMTDSSGYAYKEIILPGSIDNFELVTLTTEERDVYVQEYRPLEDANWSAAGFTLYGACSRETNWEDVVKNLQNGGSISFSITYRMTPIIEEEDE